MKESIRTFVALKVAPDILTRLEGVQRRLADRLPSGAVRWTRAEQMHLTLKFLGNVPTSRVAGLSGMLRGACADTPILRLALAELGVFPGIRQPRVLWIGLSGDAGPLARLQGRVEAATAGFGDHLETRVFHPHLTLGRVSDRDARASRAVADALLEAEFRTRLSGEWMAERVHLIQSRLGPGGASYSDLASIQLGR